MHKTMASFAKLKLPQWQAVYYRLQVLGAQMWSRWNSTPITCRFGFSIHVELYYAGHSFDQRTLMLPRVHELFS